MNGYVDPVCYDPGTIPRSFEFADKSIENEGRIELHEKNYYQRVFSDGCVELVRFDGKSGMWAILCFPCEDKPGEIAG